MLVHFPIAFGLAVPAADGLLWWNGDPFWQRAGLWAAGVAFLSGAAAAMVGLLELLLVRGARLRPQGWAHGVAGLVLVTVLATNWLLRLTAPDRVLPSGLALSVLGVGLVMLAAWHGGALVYHHGIAVDPQDARADP